MRSMRHTWILVLWLSVAGAVVASDAPLPVRTIEFATTPNDKVILELGYDQAHAYDFSTNRVNGLTLVWEGKEIVVPKRELAEITMVQIDSVRAWHGAFYSGSPYRYVHFRFGPKVDNQADDFVTATFFFVDQKYTKLKVDIPYDGTYARKVDRQHFTYGWSGDGTNRPAASIGALVERMQAEMRFHRELIKRWKANKVSEDVGAGAPDPQH